MSVAINLRDVGTAGLDRTKARESLSPIDAWIMRNTRSFQGKLETSPGQSSFNTATLTGRIMRIRSWEKDDDTQLITVYTDSKIYKVDDVTGVVTDITRAVGGDYTGGVAQPIEHSVGFDHILSTNVADNPQKWNGVTANASDIGGTPGKAGTITTALTYAILGNLVGDVRGIKWSDSGAFETWGTGDAGSLTLFQGPGKVLTLRPLGEIVIAYRENSIHMLFFVGTPFIWGQRQIINDHGLIAPRAIASITGRHVYWGTDNVYIFDGSTRIPIADKIIDEMNISFDPAFRQNILAVVDNTCREVYFCYPALGDLGVNKKAWVFNWSTGAWRQDEFEATGTGVARRRLGNAWNDSTATWDSIIGTWDQTSFSDKTPLVILGTNGGKLNFLDVGTVNNVGVSRERVMETAIFQPGALIFGDANAQATLEWLDVDQEDKGTHNLEVWIGTQNTLTGEAGITWTPYTIKADGSTRRLTIRRTARYFAIRFRTAGAAEPFRLSGLTAYFNKRGDR